MSASGVLELRTGPSIFARFFWYVLVGWWLTGIVMSIAWFLAITIVGLPLTFYLVNRVPTLLTLRPRVERFELVIGADGTMRQERIDTEQSSLAIRLVYFVLMGWWLSALWMAASYVLMLSIFGIPLGLMMVNRLPYVFSLHRGYA